MQTLQELSGTTLSSTQPALAAERGAGFTVRMQKGFKVQGLVFFGC